MYFLKLFVHFLSHYPNAAEDAAGRAVSTPRSPQPHCARGLGWSTRGAAETCRAAYPTLYSQHGIIQAQNGLWQGQGWTWMGSTATYAVSSEQFVRVLQIL